ncbi:MAG: hypothetical protein WC485_00320 [Opitutaceae bacterium]
MKLNYFGEILFDAFGTFAYQVGSSLPGDKERAWRDVDIRIILSDAEYAAMFPGCDPRNEHLCDKWCAFVMAFSTLGRGITGLPIDFQIQQQTYANEHYNGPRSSIGIVEHRLSKEPKP